MGYRVDAHSISNWNMIHSEPEDEERNRKIYKVVHSVIHDSKFTRIQTRYEKHIATNVPVKEFYIPPFRFITRDPGAQVCGSFHRTIIDNPEIWYDSPFIGPDRSSYREIKRMQITDQRGYHSHGEYTSIPTIAAIKFQQMVIKRPSRSQILKREDITTHQFDYLLISYDVPNLAGRTFKGVNIAVCIRVDFTGSNNRYKKVYGIISRFLNYDDREPYIPTLYIITDKLFEEVYDLDIQIGRIMKVIPKTKRAIKSRKSQSKALSNL
jgi:hypothetical protein